MYVCMYVCMYVYIHQLCQQDLKYMYVCMYVGRTDQVSLCRSAQA